jgi:hypothetical protein
MLPFPGRRHDMHLLVRSLKEHRVNDKIAADLGYLGSQGFHIFVPFVDLLLETHTNITAEPAALTTLRGVFAWMPRAGWQAGHRVLRPVFRPMEIAALAFHSPMAGTPSTNRNQDVVEMMLVLFNNLQSLGPQGVPADIISGTFQINRQQRTRSLDKTAPRTARYRALLGHALGCELRGAARLLAICDD